MQILVVEDEKRLSDALAQILREKKYMVDVADNGREGYDLAVSGAYDVIVLDVMLPRMSGFDVARALRRDKIKTPILMLTARDTVGDKVNGLDSGADDYMTKPFAPEELLARVRALTRRTGDVVLDEAVFDDIRLDLSSCDLSVGDRNVHLNFKEFEIMKLFITQPDMVMTKDELLTRVWGFDSDAMDNNVEVYVSFLRKKLQFLGSRVRIVSLRKIGYKLSVGGGEEEP